MYNVQNPNILKWKTCLWQTAQIEKEIRLKKACAEMLEDEFWNGDLNNKNSIENR